MIIENNSTNYDRGQTTPDYTVAVGLFLFGVLFALSLSSTFMEPYGGNQETSIVADRIANQLVGDMLVPEDGQSYEISAECATVLFEYSNGESVDVEPPGCDLRETSNLNQQFGIGDRYQVQIEIKDSNRNTAFFGGVEFIAGSSIPTQADIVVSERYVYMNGEYYTVEVRVW